MSEDDYDRQRQQAWQLADQYGKGAALALYSYNLDATMAEFKSKPNTENWQAMLVAMHQYQNVLLNYREGTKDHQ
jgi:hypothetical protein